MPLSDKNDKTRKDTKLIKEITKRKSEANQQLNCWMTEKIEENHEWNNFIFLLITSSQDKMMKINSEGLDVCY